MTIRNLERALAPNSIALIGASPEPGSVGLQIMNNLLSAEFKGPIYFVNPKYKELGAQQCFKHINELPQPPDLAVVATPPDVVPGVIGDLGAIGSRTAVVITAGLSRENGLRQAMLDAAQPNGFRVIGPNCLGMCIPGVGVNASFAHTMPSPGQIDPPPLNWSTC